jgi:ParB-like chromosome segregation protein Spo0J
MRKPKEKKAVEVVPAPEAKPPEKPPAAWGFSVPQPEMTNAGKLNPAPYNPRKISPHMIEALKRSIRKSGFVVTLVVQKKSAAHGDNVLVGGHQRIRAAREICIEDGSQMPDLPAVFLDLTDRQAKKLNVALNKIEGEFDGRLLGEVLESIHAEEVVSAEEMMEMGLEEEEFGKYLHLAEPPKVTAEGDDVKAFGRSITLSLEFDSIAQRDALKAKLLERSKVEKKKTGDVVMGMFERKKK